MTHVRNLVMTRYTNRNNIKVVFWFIAFVMVVVFCLLATGTLQSIRMGQFAASNSNNYSVSCLSAFWKTIVIFDISLSLAIFAYLALLISLNGNSSSFSLVIFCGRLYVAFSALFSLLVCFVAPITANLALITISIFSTMVFGKFRNRFDLLASTTSFGYDLLSHFRLLNRRFWLEPYARPVRVSGSLYFNRKAGFVNNFVGNF